MSESTDPSEPTRLDYPRAARLARSVFSADTRPSVGEPPEVAAARSDPERHFGGYLLIATAGVGGMGEVVRAWQEDLGRWVALKFLKGGVGDLDRFLLEARSAARLDHPGIAKVFETGEHAGRPFIALQWIDGEPLQRVQLAPERAAEVIGETARALAHAHERGVIHRDVKPSNILLTREGKPVLVDFGLARAVDAPQLTQTGTALGTPGFMAPEQASGQAGPLADVYGLGATLYYLTTGRAPHEGATIAELLVRVTQEDPPPPRRWSPRLDRDLETVILHCLAREPGRRYPAAAALAEDLERWRRGEPIHARRVGRGERLWRWARRRPAAAALIAVVALGGPLGVGLALGSADVRRAARGQAAADLAERELLLGRLPEAEAAAERAVATLPAAATGHYWRGRVLLTRYAAARELPPPAVCDGLLELAPPLPEAPESRRCREEALDAFGRMRTAADRRPGPDAVAAGLDALFAHRAGEAAAHLDRAWQAGVIEPDVGLLRVEAHYLARDFAGALAALEELAGRREKGARHLIWEARILQALAVEATLSGNNPMPHLERALRLADAAGAAGAPATDAPVLRAQALLTRAAHEQATGADPEPTLAQAAAALEPGLAAGGCDLLLAWGDVLLARAELRRRIGAVDPAAPAEYQAAIDAFGRAVAARPDYAGGYLRRAAAERALAHFLVGLARCPQDLLRTGREECTRALERAPESELAAVFRTWFERIAALDPPTAAAEGRRAQEQAAADLEARAAASADPARALQEAALALVDRSGMDGTEVAAAIELLERACTLLDRAIARHPRYQSALLLRGNARLRIAARRAGVGEDAEPAYRAALADYTLALESHPRSADALAYRGSAGVSFGTWLRRGGRDGAEASAAGLRDLDQAVAVDARCVLGYEWRAVARQNLAPQAVRAGTDPVAAYAGALADCDRAVALSPPSAPPLVARALCRYRIGVALGRLGRSGEEELRQAEGDLSGALALRPEEFEARLWRGRVRLMRGIRKTLEGGDPAAEYDAALEDLDAAVRARPEDAEARLRRASALRRRIQHRAGRGEDSSEDLKRAYADLDCALAGDSRNAEAWFLRGTLRMQFGPPAGAQEDLERAFALDPTLREAYQRER